MQRIPESAVLDVVFACYGGIYRATKYMSPKLVVRATRVFKQRKNETHTEMRLSICRPNWNERIFIKQCQKAGEPFPVKKVQLKTYPVKRNSKKAKK